MNISLLASGGKATKTWWIASHLPVGSRAPFPFFRELRAIEFRGWDPIHSCQAKAFRSKLSVNTFRAERRRKFNIELCKFEERGNRFCVFIWKRFFACLLCHDTNWPNFTQEMFLRWADVWKARTLLQRKVRESRCQVSGSCTKSKIERICAFDCMDIAEVVEPQKLSTDCCAFADWFLLQVSRSMIYENVDSLQTLLLKIYWFFWEKFCCWSTENSQEDIKFVI